GAALGAYLTRAHRRAEGREGEGWVRSAHDGGIRLMRADFPPFPGPRDGEACGRGVDLDEPLWHNKTVFALTSLGAEADRLKALCRELNQRLSPALKIPRCPAPAGTE